MTGWTSALARGLAEHLAAAGLAVFRATGVYQADEVGVVFATMPQSPDRVLVLTAYGVTDEPELPLSTVAVQVRARGTADPRTADDLADAVYDLLHGATRLVLGGVRVALVLRQSTVPLGRDENGRWERTDNYYLTCQRPTPHRPQT